MFIKNAYNYFKYRKIIKEVIASENLLENLSKIFSSENYIVNFKEDWIGRIYAVVNPSVSDPQSRIFEYNNQGTSISSYVSKWVIEHMIAADTFVKNHNLFDILVYNIKQIDSDYNFLVTLTNIAWFDFWKDVKITLGVLTTLLIVGIVVLCIVL